MPVTRTEKFINSFDFEKFDAAIIEDEENRRYFTGFPSTAGTLIITKAGAFLCVDSRYIEAAQNSAFGCDVLLVNGVKDFFPTFCEKHSIKTAVLSGEITLSRYERLKTMLSGVEISTYTTFDETIKNLRSIKDNKEIAAIRAAQEITDKAFLHILDYIKIGITEKNVALELEFFMRKNGAEAAAFDTIAVSGKRGSMPHGVPSEKPLENGDFLTLDYGAKVDGYCSDMTRTVAIGSVSGKQKEIYETVLLAQKTCLNGLKAGVLGFESDNLARKVINDAGYGKFFGHSTGHSIGLFVHESPSLSPLSKETLKANQLVTVEPGIYLPDEFGVRIEDLAVITEDGCDDLTTSPKELIII